MKSQSNCFFALVVAVVAVGGVGVLVLVFADIVVVVVFSCDELLKK